MHAVYVYCRFFGAQLKLIVDVKHGVLRHVSVFPGQACAVTFRHHFLFTAVGKEESMKMSELL